ncbi:MAG: universal stress protein [Bacteroidetes bacterium]|nr:universal stress protein [Bacteroidota bacterium]
MKKFLVPVDFSDASINAARYAVQLTQDIEGSEVILYHVYGKLSLASLTSKEEGSRQRISENALEEVKQKVALTGVEKISVVAEEGSFVENLSDYTLGNSVAMVIMGITGSSRITQVFMGTNTLNVIRNIACPVMIIPPDAAFHGLKKVALTSDFKDVARTTPFPSLKKILDIFHPELHILNVDSEHFVELTPEYKIEREAMEDRLGMYNPQFSFLRAYEFLDGINDYVELRKMDAIITVPRKHSFLSQLFKTSHTKKLAYYSTVPIIAISE